MSSTSFSRSVRAGAAAIRRRPGLVALLYAADLAAAFVLAVPLYSAVAAVVGPTGYGTEMASGFDPGLWADVLGETGPVLRGAAAQLAWALPLCALWKAAAGVGLVYASRSLGGAFWTGVGRFTGRGVRVGLRFLGVFLLLVLGAGVAGLVSTLLWPGEIGVFWTWLVVIPALLALGFCLLDLMHDYARIALVVDDVPPARAWRTGAAWPFRHGASVALYGLWLAPALLLAAGPVVLDLTIAAVTPVAIWGLFALQQLLMLLRSAVTVGWYGSETAYLEEVRFRALPRIARGGDDPDGTAPGPGREALIA